MIPAVPAVPAVQENVGGRGMGAELGAHFEQVAVVRILVDGADHPRNLAVVSGDLGRLSQVVACVFFGGAQFPDEEICW